MTIEPGMRIAGPAPANVSGTGDVRQDTLPAGPAATTLHAGPYEELSEAYGAVEQWIRAEGLKSGGAPWECYVNSPGEFPNPKGWKTEVYWPLAH
jgi:effector-binding domain-containing protein